MTNKFTKAVDEFFSKWCKSDAELIPFYYCHQGDEDGRCDEFCWSDWWEVEHMFNAAGVKLDTDKYDDEQCRQDWEKLTDMIWKAFSNKVSANYDSTNCYYSRYYFITKNYTVEATTNNRVKDLDLECLDEKYVDFSTISEEEADSAEDKNIIESIDSHIDDISSLARDLQHNNMRDKVIEKLSDVIKTIQKSMTVQS